MALLGVVLSARGETAGSFNFSVITETVFRESNYATVSEVRTCSYDERGLLIAMEYASASETISCRVYYQYDTHRNPRTCSVVYGEGTSAQRTVTLALEREYSGDELLSVTGDNAPGLELWRILEHFTGCRNATVTCGETVRRYKNGLCVYEKTSLNGSSEDDLYVEVWREYLEGCLVQDVIQTVIHAAVDSRIETLYRRDGLMEAFVRDGVRSEIIYEAGTDPDGNPCLIGRFLESAADSLPEDAPAGGGQDDGIRAYVDEAGRLTALYMRENDTTLILRYDAGGNLVYREIAPGDGSRNRMVFTYQGR